MTKIFAIRTPVHGIHLDTLYLDQPPAEALAAKLAREIELHGPTDHEGTPRWSIAMPMDLAFAEGSTLKPTPVDEAVASSPQGADDNSASLPTVGAAGVGTVTYG